jgi:Asp/Glu/hydantoin racemase
VNAPLPRFACFHATTNAIAPAVAALRERQAGIELRHYVDEGLLDAERNGASADTLAARLGRWMRQIECDGCAAALLTCSSFSYLLPRLRLMVDLPLVGIDEALHATAVATGRRIAVLATLPSALPVALRSLERLAAERGSAHVFTPRLVDGAFAALQSGDSVAHDRLIREQLLALAPEHDVLLLAQISMVRARHGLPAHPPVLAATDTAPDALLAAGAGATSTATVPAAAR